MILWNNVVVLLIVLFACMILNYILIHSYKTVLVAKSKDGSAECINGKFYYIVEEGDHEKAERLLRSRGNVQVRE